MKDARKNKIFSKLNLNPVFFRIKAQGFTVGFGADLYYNFELEFTLSLLDHKTWKLFSEKTNRIFYFKTLNQLPAIVKFDRENKRLWRDFRIQQTFDIDRTGLKVLSDY